MTQETMIDYLVKTDTINIIYFDWSPLYSQNNSYIIHW